MANLYEEIKKSYLSLAINYYTENLEKHPEIQETIDDLRKKLNTM
jgi:hypothetical protein